MSNDDEILSDELMEQMGFSHDVIEAMSHVLGRRPRTSELSTLIAMWQSNGCQQSLLGWLRGQKRNTDYHDYIYSGDDQAHNDIREPRVRDCIDIAHSLHLRPISRKYGIEHGHLLFLVGHVSDTFLGSVYAKQYLHLSEHPMRVTDATEQVYYYNTILAAMLSAHLLGDYCPVQNGGLFGTLVQYCNSANPQCCGFDILTCREVRLDSFLFGEEEGRFVASLPEEADELFLQKLDEAGIDCCFLGRATRGRVLVDNMDFGSIESFISVSPHVEQQ